MDTVHPNIKYYCSYTSDIVFMVEKILKQSLLRNNEQYQSSHGICLLQAFTYLGQGRSVSILSQVEFGDINEGTSRLCQHGGCPQSNVTPRGCCHRPEGKGETSTDV